MTISMQDDHVVSIAELKEFVKLSRSAIFARTNRAEAYEWIGRTLGKFRYFSETKKNRGAIKAYIRAMTGYSDTQLDRLIRRKKAWGRIVPKERTQPAFPRVYTVEDVARIVAVDNAEGRRNGRALKKTLSDMYRVYGDQRFERLANISVAHLYNLRGTRMYQSHSLTYEKTHATAVAIGVRKKPEPFGKPGFLRVDSVHQGDLDKEKGVYHVNLVDEVTQWEIVVSVEGISEEFLKPALEAALDQFPFILRGFHSDNGSEYINAVVARLLAKLLIEQTKSRARRTNDNALVESKNGSVVRKHLGYMHIPRRYARLLNEFDRRRLNPYLNFHRQCAFPEETIDAKGKIRKAYRTYLTPAEKLLAIENVERCLKPGVTRASLRGGMMERTHLAAAEEMQKAKQQLFVSIHHRVVP